MNTLINNFKMSHSVDRIFSINFISVLRDALKISECERTQEDIEIIAKCATFIEFFKKIMELDPYNGASIIEESSRYFTLQEYYRGQPIMEHKDQPDTAYIVLSGRVGVFIPIQEDFIRADQSTLKYILRNSESGSVITNAQILLMKRFLPLTKEQRKLISLFTSIESGKVVYNEEKFQRLSGGIEYSEMPQSAFTSDHVSLLSSIGTF